MSIFDVTPAGAFVNAVVTANEKDRLEAAHLNTAVLSPVQTNQLSSVVRVVGRTLFRAGKSTAKLRLALRSRTA